MAILQRRRTSPDLESPSTDGPAEEPTENPADRADRADRADQADTAPVRRLPAAAWLVVAAHPRQVLVTALAIAVAAAASGRAAGEVLLVLATVAVGQTVLGWHNDLVDRGRDAAHDTPGKPLADGRLDPGTTWYALTVAVLVLVPLSISGGVTAGAFYLVSTAVALLGNVVLRQGPLSWLPWAASFALYPAYLSHGGWGGSYEGDAPRLAMVVLAAALGVGVHVVRSIWGLVADDADEWHTLPLLLGRRLGASRLLLVGAVYCAVVVAAIVYVGLSSGLAA
ncbi:MAG: hypothetical protein CMH83_18375 [Nocardioides sp.]|nr:hypothetical protein [Nocardioides sp.]